MTDPAVCAKVTIPGWMAEDVDWTDVVCQFLEGDVASAMSTSHHPVRPDQVVVTVATRFETPVPEGFTLPTPTKPNTLILIEVSAPMNYSLAKDGALERALLRLKELVMRPCPAAWDDIAHNLVTVGFVPMTMCV
jgi:hypothetical protein